MLVAQTLSKSFAGRPAVLDVSLSVRPGEVVGLLGPNGAGKTTTFRMLTGLLAVDRGRILLDGLDITRMEDYDRARLGMIYLPQESCAFHRLTVSENFELVLETRDARGARRREMQDMLLDQMGIAHLGDTALSRLSGGERRRVEIALALACEPRFVLLDEPFTGIDPIAVHDLQEVVRGLARRGVGALVTDHKARELLSMVDRAYVIFEGRVLAEGAADTLIGDPMVRQIYLGETFQL